MPFTPLQLCETPLSKVPGVPPRARCFAVWDQLQPKIYQSIYLSSHDLDNFEDMKKFKTLMV